jgi:hypothetical protein
VRATAAGRDVFARVTRRVREFHRAQWAALSEAELTQLGDLLAKALWGATDVAEAGGQHAAAGGGERS